MMSEQHGTVLIADDDGDSREILSALLGTQGYRLVFATTGKEALHHAARFLPDLVLLDVMMPEIDGFEVCRRLRSNALLAEVPVVILTALNDRESRLQGIGAGADDFISKPFDMTELRMRVQTILRLNRYRSLLEERAKVAEEIRRSRDELARAYDETLHGWVKALDMRDHATEGHSQRVMALTVALAQAFGICDEELEHIRRGALLHDVGKMAIPDRVLHKTSCLTSEEQEIMRRHPTYAYEWLSQVEFLRPALVIPYYHHERWDGSGYPQGLKGYDIPLAARIFAVADVWDALCSDRPYHRAWNPADALAYIRNQAGTAFDPDVVAVFLAHMQAYAE